MLGRQSALRGNLRTSARIQVISLIRSFANFRYDSQAQGYVYPISVTESSLPAIQIAIGDPNGAGRPAWPKYDAASDQHIEFGDLIAVKANLRKPAVDLFERIALERRGRRKATGDH